MTRLNKANWVEISKRDTNRSLTSHLHTAGSSKERSQVPVVPGCADWIQERTFTTAMKLLAQTINKDDKNSG